MSRATPDLPCRKESYGYGAVTLAAGVFHRLFSLYLPCVTGVLYPAAALTAPVWARPCSIASTGGFTVVFSSSGYLDVSVHRVRSFYKVPYLLYGGSPHSDIPGSKPVCGSPGLFAAYRVFRRFLKPRHPPSALVYFLYSLHGLHRPCVIALSVVSKILCPSRLTCLRLFPLFSGRRGE